MLQKNIDDLNVTIDSHFSKIKAISQDTLTFKKNPAKWSKKEILGHLIDSAQNNIQRFVRCQYEQVPTLIYNQDEWVKLNNYQQGDFNEMIDLWRLLNRRITHIWQNIPQENLTRRCDLNGEVVTIEWLIEDYIRHLKHHLKQISSN